MKKTIVLLLVLGSTFSLLAQNSQQLFKGLTEKYADNDGFSASMLTKDMFDLYLRKKSVENSSEIAETLNSLDNILVVSQNKYGAAGLVNFFEEKEKVDESSSDILYEEILKHYKSSNFNLLKTEKQMGEDIKVFLKRTDGKVTALALITNSSALTNLVELTGDINLKNIASLGKVINLNGLENLYKLDNRGGHLGQFPMKTSYSYYWDGDVKKITENAREMAKKHAKLSKKQVKEIEQQAIIQAEKQRKIADIQREMVSIHGRKPIFLSTPGDTNTVYYINGEKIKGSKVKKMLKGADIKQISTTNKSKDGKKSQTVIRIITK